MTGTKPATVSTGYVYPTQSTIQATPSTYANTSSSYVNTPRKSTTQGTSKYSNHICYQIYEARSVKIALKLGFSKMS